MKKLVSPKFHCVTDYLLPTSLLIMPTVLGFDKKVKSLYTAEAIALLGYVALTDSPVALKPLIPFLVHGQIDPFNIGQFALQSFLKPFRKDKKALLFNIAFTAVAGTVVLVTNWNGRTKKSL